MKTELCYASSRTLAGGVTDSGMEKPMKQVAHLDVLVRQGRGRTKLLSCNYLVLVPKEGVSSA